MRGNTGATGGGKSEWEVNYEIAMLNKAIIEAHGIAVYILPATVPQEYWADVFVVHPLHNKPVQPSSPFHRAKHSF